MVLNPMKHSCSFFKYYLSFVAKKVVYRHLCFLLYQYVDSLVLLALSICRLRKLAFVFEIVSNMAVFSTRFSLGF